VATRPLQLQRPSRPDAASLKSLWLGLLAAATAALVASMLAYNTKVGVAILVALCFVPLALLRLRLAICAWVVLLFFSRTSALEAIPNKLLLFIVAAWLGLLLGRRAHVREALARNRALIAWTVALIVWSLLTLAWAPLPGAAERPIKELLYAGLGLLLVIGAVTERSHVRWILAAFVSGAALSVLWGAARGGLSVRDTGVAGEIANLQGRFQGGAGDPNYLAAVLVPGIMVAGGLAIRASLTRRLLLAIATAIIAVGLAATQSRGGLLAAIVCAVAALIIWRGRRGMILALIGLAIAAAVVFFAANPGALHRIEHSNHGSGRYDIWTIAWRIVRAHPLFGVGMAQFPQVSLHYVLLPGLLEYVPLIEKGIVVHNVYLQLWVETGIVGLLLFLSLVVTSLVGAFRAIATFDRLGDTEMSSLARTVMLALLGMLTASFFLSNLEAGQLWVLLALGPAMAEIARRAARAEPVLEPVS
jgi:O-antigen ligase